MLLARGQGELVTALARAHAETFDCEALPRLAPGGRLLRSGGEPTQKAKRWLRDDLDGNDRERALMRWRCRWAWRVPQPYSRGAVGHDGSGGMPGGVDRAEQVTGVAWAGLAACEDQRAGPRTGGTRLRRWVACGVRIIRRCGQRVGRPVLDQRVSWCCGLRPEQRGRAVFGAGVVDHGERTGEALGRTGPRSMEPDLSTKTAKSAFAPLGMSRVL